jgi:hypothetical protein
MKAINLISQTNNPHHTGIITIKSLRNRDLVDFVKKLTVFLSIQSETYIIETLQRINLFEYAKLCRAMGYDAKKALFNSKFSRPISIKQTLSILDDIPDGKPIIISNLLLPFIQEDPIESDKNRYQLLLIQKLNQKSKKNPIFIGYHAEILEEFKPLLGYFKNSSFLSYELDPPLLENSDFQYKFF